MGGKNVRRVVLLLLAAAVLSSCSSTPTKRSANVGWLPLAPVTTTSTSTTTTTLADAKPCEAGQLYASIGRGGAGLGNELTVIDLTNMGSTCRLSGYPELIGKTATHGTQRIPSRNDGTYFGNLIPMNLATDKKGELFIGTSEGCGSLNEPTRSADIAHALANTYHGIQLVLPDGEGIVAARVTFDAACGVSESELGVPPPVPGAVTEVPGTPGTLTATLSLPKTAQSGKALEYMVTLHNPTKTTVRWTRCPNYTESLQTTLLVGRNQLLSKTYQLNCSQALRVRPGHSVRFAMQLPLVKVAKSSSAKFSWQLATGNGPFLASSVLLFAAR